MRPFGKGGKVRRSQKSEAKHNRGERAMTAAWYQEGQLARDGDVALTVEEAMADKKYGQYYLAAIKAEHAQHLENKTYEKERDWNGAAPQKHPTATVITAKYVFEKKRCEKGVEIPDEPVYYTDEQGQTWKFKVRMVARGFQQKPNDYGTTYAPTPLWSSLLMIVAMSVSLRWTIHNLDVKGAFLLPPLPEEERVYMRPPKGDAVNAGWLFWLLKC
jgi:phage pi2 protein 07